jgi:hypothetical protein
MRSLRAVLLLVPAFLSLAANSPDPLTRLKTACEESKDQAALHRALQALAPALGAELLEDFNLHPMRPGSYRYTLRFRRPIDAERLLDVMGWTRAYAVSGDVHQETWGIRLWASDLPDDGTPGNNPLIGTQNPRLGLWAVMASLAGRPAGDLPKVSAGASPAYDLTTYPAQVTEIEIEPWSPDWQ